MKKILYILFIIVFYPSILTAQEGDIQDNIYAEDNIGIKALSSSVKKVPGGQALLEAISPEKYIVGPGDGLIIQVWGGADLYHRVTVTPEGKIVIPTLGTLNVKDKTLKEVYEQVREVVSRYYKNVWSSTTLSVLRTFEVFVLGEVKKPGIYYATLITRVSELINEAGGILESGSIRNIELRNNNTPIRRVDLLAFLRDGEIEQNPTVSSEGLIIFVPVIQNLIKVNMAEIKVRDDGTIVEIETSRILEIRHGETIKDLISKIGEINPWSDLEKAYIERATTHLGKKTIIPVNLYKLMFEKNEAYNIPLEIGDILTIPAIKSKVYVTGWVKNAGPVSFKPNRYVNDYIGMAGGPDGRGKMSKVIVYRDNKVVSKGRNIPVQPGDTIFVPEKSVKWWQDYLTILNIITTALIYIDGLF